MHTGLSLALTGVARNALNTPALMTLHFDTGVYTNLAGYNRTNYVPNSTMVGATASTLPTGWSFQAATGLTQSVVGTGTEFGRNYIDWSVVGTTSTTTAPLISTSPGGLSAATNAPAATGQTWTSSIYYRLISGTLPANTFGVGFIAYNSAGVGLGTVLVNTSMTSGGFARNSGTATIASATTAGVQSFIGAGGGLPAGTYNFVLRIYQPQLEQAGSPSSDILTTSAPVTVKTYISNNPADVGNLTYTRAGTAYASDASGNLISFGANVPRITNLGYLAEPSATNGFLASQDFTDAAWTKLGLTPSANTTTAPDGTLTADTVTISALTEYHYFSQIVTATASEARADAIYVKPSTQRYVWLEQHPYLSGADLGSSAVAIFDLQTLTITSSGGTGNVPSITPAAFGFYRLSINGTLSATANQSQLRVGFTNSSTVINTYLGNGTDNVAFWQADTQSGSKITSPILTTTAPVTRPADVGYYTLSSSLSGAYSLAAVGQSNAGSGNSPGLVQLDGGTDSDRVLLASFVSVSTTQGSPIVQVGGATQFNPSPGSVFTNGNSFGVAISIQASRMAASVSGSAISAGTGTVPTVSNLRLGSASAGGNILNGTLKSAAVYSSALSDAEVIYRSPGNY